MGQRSASFTPELVKSLEEGRCRTHSLRHLVDVLGLGDKRKGSAVDVLVKRVEIPFVVLGWLYNADTSFEQFFSHISV